MAPPPMSPPQPSTRLLNLMPEPMVDLISPIENDITNTANCFIQEGSQLARSLRLSGSRVHLFPRVSRPSFLLYLPRSFGGNLPNLTLTEFDPSNSPASPITSINVNDLFNSPSSVPSCPKKTPSFDEKKKTTQSEGGDNLRESFTDYNWGEKRRLITLNRWSNKGAFALWGRDGTGKHTFISKSISNEDMARRWGLKVDMDILAKARKHKSPSPSSSLDSAGSSSMNEKVETLCLLC